MTDEAGCRFPDVWLWMGADKVGRHENIIAILDIIAPPSYEEFNEVYLVQVSLLPHVAR